MKAAAFTKHYPEPKLLFTAEEKDSHSLHAAFLLKAHYALLERTAEGDLLKEASNLPCFYCLKTFPKESITIDHFKPRYFRGTNEPSNLKLCCEPCNKAKGSIYPKRMPVTFKKWLKSIKAGNHPRRLNFLEEVFAAGGYGEVEKSLLEKLIWLEARAKKHS